MCFDANVVSDDEDDGEEDDLHDEELSEDLREWTPVETSFDLDGPPSTQGTDPVIVEDEEDRQTTTDAVLFFHYHQRFGHASPAKLQLMAKAGIIPRRLARCPIPVCSSCLYGKATKRPWRGKSTKKSVSDVLPITRPGQVVSVDQLVSPTPPGLIAQMSGFLTNKRYCYATVFADNFSSLSFMWLQKTATATETIEAKKAFEAYATTHGVPVLHYHADNGIFNAYGWRAACAEKGQGLSFAGVNAHHQNGKAERRIGLLQEKTRTQLIHVNRRWPTAITANLWPYALYAQPMTRSYRSQVCRTSA
jgi:transposase InsO family protein